MASTWNAGVKLVRNGGVSLGKSTSFTTIKSTADGVFVHPIGVDDKIGFVVKFTSSATANSNTVTVAAGDKFQASKGALTYKLTSTDAAKEYIHILGPFESARFGKASTHSTAAAKTGENVITLSCVGHKTTGTTTHATTAGSTNNNIQVKAFRMPVVDL